LASSLVPITEVLADKAQVLFIGFGYAVWCIHQTYGDIP